MPLPPTTTWLSRIHGLTATLRHRHPGQQPLLDDLDRLAADVARATDLATTQADPGDGLRSPGTAPGRSIGGHSDPVLALVEAHLDGRPAATLDRARAARDLAVTCLATALTADGPLLTRLLEGARTELATALGHAHGLLPRTTIVRRIRAEHAGDPGCASCRRAQHFSPVHAAGLCRTCYRHALADRAAWADANPLRTPAPTSDRRWWPPVGYVEHLRDRGHERVTTKQLEAWRTADRRPKPKKNRRKAS